MEQSFLDGFVASMKQRLADLMVENAMKDGQIAQLQAQVNEHQSHISKMEGDLVTARATVAVANAE